MLLHELIERQAQRRPQAAAILFKGLSMTYGQLQEKVEKWASALQSRGVKSGDAFGVVMRNSPEFIITFFALVRLCARVVPINFLLKADEIAYIFEDAGVVGVITQPAFLTRVMEARRKLPKMRDVVVTG
jgi:acyl-CoA synthetase (AMP-forming)/AMP-acid ligase II